MYFLVFLFFTAHAVDVEFNNMTYNVCKGDQIDMIINHDDVTIVEIVNNTENIVYYFNEKMDYFDATSLGWFAENNQKRRFERRKDGLESAYLEIECQLSEVVCDYDHYFGPDTCHICQKYQCVERIQSLYCEWLPIENGTNAPRNPHADECLESCKSTEVVVDNQCVDCLQLKNEYKNLNCCNSESDDCVERRLYWDTHCQVACDISPNLKNNL